ncbi:MAG: glycosyltransferase family 2 protein [Sarcina sp.]
MYRKNSFSLILATYGRKKEIKNFIEALLKSDYDLKYVELIIVDQNDIINLDSIIAKYKGTINLKHIKSNIKGLSKNRNIGLRNATGDIVAFPDDDCEYLVETLSTINKNFNQKKCDLILGRIVQHDGSDSLRIWDKKESIVSTKNFYKKCSSITLFIKIENAKIELNENLGVGEYFGACEDADLIYKNCKMKLKVEYIPEIKIYHPHYDSASNMTSEKIYSYGLGFGGMVKENMDIDMSILFIKAQVYHFLKMIMHICKFDSRQAKNSYTALISRFKGVVKYGRTSGRKGFI